LEYILKQEGSLPPILYYQIDGGSENTARIVYVMMEYLIAKRMFHKIVVTRLMVGHTHEDIDAVYGRVWKSIRCKHVLTPQSYTQALKECLKRKREEEFLEIKDIIVIPDYEKHFQGCWDKKFGHYAKGVNTQHQFIFESVPTSTLFPLGCKTTYRAFSSDEVVELIEDINSITGLTAVNTKVTTFPVNTIDNENVVGMFFLHKFPDKLFQPVPFLTGSSEEFQDVMFKVNAFWAKQAVHNVNDWKDFQDKTPIPSSDSVLDYIDANPQQFYIPLLQELFHKIPSERESSIGFNSQNTTQQLINNLPVVTVQPVVSWNNRGVPNDKLKKTARKLMIHPSLPHHIETSTTCNEFLSALDSNNNQNIIPKIDLIPKETADIINCISDHCAIKPRKQSTRKTKLVAENLIPKVAISQQGESNVKINNSIKKNKFKSAAVVAECNSIITSQLQNYENNEPIATEIASNNNVNDVAGVFITATTNKIISNTSRKRKQMQILNREKDSSNSEFESSNKVIIFYIYLQNILNVYEFCV